MTALLPAAGPFIIAFWVILAILFSRHPQTRGFVYTLMIFAAVTTAMYYPQYFLTIGGFDLSKLITPLIQIIMFGMGTAMSLRDFYGVIKMPMGVFTGVVCHFTIMPFVGWGLAHLFSFPPEIAAGVVLIGTVPCGMASNVISYLAKANLALSVTLTAVSTMMAPFVTPFLMQWLAGSYIDISVSAMMWDICKIVILPVAAGLLFNHFLSGKLKWLDNAMPKVSMSAIAFIIVIITAKGRESLLDVGALLILSSLIHNLSGYTLGYWLCRLIRMNEQDCRTIAIEVGMQNGGLATAIAKDMGKIATVGLAPAVFGPLMNVTGSLLASWWHRHPPKEAPNEKAVQLETERL
ncbi:bile acid:sodium symporter family protein [Chitinophaga filiformis]|uniref:bile acid:sodium symporter family protein n=1 Tax=Chitinophaga filiformis TaxID=104663 RepID=UPI001F44DDDA|nr:bile acid:sodium symporter family protein [Chitinophaga filiformis]MCF6402667.1 bile acid:sodium symporter family protein [Chitinophaga filiformis]MCF6403415.1 bile acid:sodium symporter family protein [Chitinophaga filiformis]